MPTDMERWRPLRRWPAKASSGLPWPRSMKVSRSAKPVSQPLSSFSERSLRNRYQTWSRHQLTPVVSDGRILPALAKAAHSHPAPYPIHLKVETGMGRLGFSPEELRSLLDNPLLRSPLQVEGMMTHLADADGKDSAFTERQLDAFRAMLEQIRQRGFTLPLVHAANSAAIVRFPDAHFSLVRPGIMLYGYHTLPDTVPAPDLKPVLSFTPRSSNYGPFHEGEPSATTGHSSRHDRHASQCCRSAMPTAIAGGSPIADRS